MVGCLILKFTATNIQLNCILPLLFLVYKTQDTNLDFQKVLTSPGLFKRSETFKEKHIYQKEKKSRGLEATKQRLESLSDDSNSIKIIDKIDRNNQPLGTKVIIKIPLQPFNTAT